MRRPVHMLLVGPMLLGLACTPEEDTGTMSVEVQARAGQTCEAAKRQEFGPMFLADPGPDWYTQPEPPEAADFMAGGGAAVADLNGDGRLDIFLPHNGPDQLFIGQPDGTFVDETEWRWPFDDWAMSTGASAANVDGDGDLDLVVARIMQQNQLFINDGDGYFYDATASSGLVDFPWVSSSVSWGDFEGDGDLDLFISNFGDPTSARIGAAVLGDTGPGDPHELYVNEGDGTFKDVSYLIPKEVREGHSFASGWHDLDLDGDLDLYVTHDFGPQNTGNHFMRNDGGTFTDVSKETGLDLVIYGMGLGVGDLGGDGLPDVIVTSGAELPILEASPDGVWTRTEKSRGLILDPEEDRRSTGWGVEIADMNNDGRMDVVVAYGQGPTDEENLAQFGKEGLFSNPPHQPDGLYIQQEDGTLKQSADEWGVADNGFSRGFVLADLNDDGYLDIVKQQLDRLARVYLSNCGGDGWLRVALRGPSPNTHAVGARIEIEAGGQTHMRWIQVGSTSMVSSGPAEAHFGLGDAAAVDRMTIYWPDGEISVMEDLAPKQILTVIREDVDYL